MKNFKEIYQGKIHLKNYLFALRELKKSMSNPSEALYEDSKMAKIYYLNAMKMAVDNNFFDNKMINTVNTLNEGINDVSSEKTTNEILCDNIDLIIEELEMLERNILRITLGDQGDAVELVTENILEEKEEHVDESIEEPKKVLKLNKEFTNDEVPTLDSLKEGILQLDSKINERLLESKGATNHNGEDGDEGEDGKVEENMPVATQASVNGMGDVSLPAEGEKGSGDVPGGATGATASSECEDTNENERPRLKKFDTIHKEVLKEKEIYFSIDDFGDTASLIEVISSEMSKKYNVDKSELHQDLTRIFISYNGEVDIKSLGEIGEVVKKPLNVVKKDIDSIISENIHLLEALQMESLNRLLNGEESLNEGIIGRAIGAIGGFALGPKIGKLIAKVLGIQKGPLYNLLTSRVVGAALAQELTKNLI